MSTLTKISLKEKINTDIVTNTSRSITANKLNEILVDIADSMRYLNSGELSSQPSSYTIVIEDAGKFLELNSTTDVDLIIPNDSSAALASGTKIDVMQYNTGVITITAAPGVTLRSQGNRLRTNGVYAVCSLFKRSNNEWIVYGNVIA